MLCMVVIIDWHMESVDFIQAFPQAPIKTEIFMHPPEVPSSFTIPDLPNFIDRFNNVYKLLKNLYGLKDARKTWNDYLDKGLIKRGWEQSKVDAYLYTKNGIILALYVDDAVLISTLRAKIDFEIKSLKQDYDLTDEGELKDYLGTRSKKVEGRILLRQTHMVDKILSSVDLNNRENKVYTKNTPALATHLLNIDSNRKQRKQHWNYRSVVGQMEYLQCMTLPDISFAVQQCARFCNGSKVSHEEAVKHICRYLLKPETRAYY